ncbi:MAG TPA: photosynthetic reaction center cytochrome c subunit family protein [Thermoanaerobaculia bacterium]|nr:photosynthetic reaction center cytochrome c subunit family protein [Thermoanaerobaculia bacterium]
MRIAIRDLVAGGLLLAGLATVPALSIAQSKPETPAPAAKHDHEHGSGDPEQLKAAVAALHKAIAGRENEPSEKVFKNIKSFTGVPAGHLLGAMEKGFSPALGVSCAHCHDIEHWESDAKDEKQAARGMMKLVGEINAKLKDMPGLMSDKPMVNCTTCHRGQVKPALNLDEKEHH